ncbi:MAG: amidase [Dehalococcoidia bacterium]
MAQPYDLTLTQAAAAVRSKQLSPVELTQSLIDRIERLEPKLVAWATLVPEQALEAARQAEASDGGGVLRGVPFGAKDIFDSGGIRTAAGSRVWADRVPDKDSAAIAMTKGAGGILLGKTNTTEFADGDPAPSRNPWNAEHTPGGSSTGSGVAVAARMVPWAFGTQTVGSVLRPAAYNGVVGFKPTFGRISRIGVIPQAMSFDHVGVLCRSVEDVAMLLTVLAGYDADDPYSADVPKDDYLAGLDDTTAPRIGLLRGWFVEESDAETREKIDQVAKALSGAGAMVDVIEPRIDFGYAYAKHRIMQESETAVWHAPLYLPNKQLYGPKLTAYIENGYKHSAMQYAEALEFRHSMQRLAADAMRGVDVLLMPTASGPAPKDLTQTGDTRFQSPWSYIGFPSITIPVGLAANGLPLGAQMAAPPFQETRLLRAARWAERVLDVQLTPPLEE